MKQRALRPRRVVDYKSEGACETPMWLAGTKSHSEEGGIAKQDKKQVRLFKELRSESAEKRYK